jgi:hypothetical protein
MEASKLTKESAPKQKVNTRGVLKVSGFDDFNPQVNVQLEKTRHSKRESSKKAGKQGGCCK